MSEATSTIDYGVTRDGLTQLRRRWKATGTARAVVLIVHGISEHSGRYEAVAQQLAEAGFHVVAYDHRGHGQSAGRRTYVDSFDELVDDLEDHLREVRKLGLPVVLLGHSMGGLIATAYAVSTRPQPHYLVLSAPALGAEVPSWQRVGAPYVSNLAPKLFLPSPMPTSVLSRDPDVIEAYEQDPLIKPGATARMGAELLRTMETVGAQLANISVPTLVVHGADDELVPAAASVPIDDVAGVERWELPGLRHEIFNEPEGPSVLTDVINWINLRLFRV